MTEDVLAEWEEASRRLTQQNDGMVNLWQIADVLQQPSCIDRLSISLWGIGGEIARGFYSEPKAFLFPHGLEGIQRFLSKRLVKDHRRLIRHEATALAQTYLQQFVEEVVAEDFVPLDVPDVFYTYERVRRWAGSNARKGRPISDRFSPFCSRPFLEAAFAMPAQHRYSESLHYELIRLLVPDLHRFPFAKEPWPSQQPLMNIVRSLAEGAVRKVYGGIHYRLFPSNLKKPIQPPSWDHSAWLEAMCPRLRELCLDHANSSLWDFVDRSVFQRVISNVTDAVERRRYIGGLYNVATLFYYYN
jgi:asparagine synthase (glutamine-hydrolysing)